MKTKNEINKPFKNSKLKDRLFVLCFEKDSNITIYVLANSIKEAYNKFKNSKFKNKFGKSISIYDSPQDNYKEINIISKNPNKSYRCDYEIKGKDYNYLLIAESFEQCLDYLKNLDLVVVSYRGDGNKFIF
jgi:hypothetical protein